MTPALFQIEFVRNGSIGLQLGRISCFISNCLLFNTATAIKWSKLTGVELVPMCNPTMKNWRNLNAPCRHKKETCEREILKNTRRDVSEIVRRLKAVNHCISPLFTRFYWINYIKCAADFAIYISVYHSLVDEKFYS